jgi:hypothetical protein
MSTQAPLLPATGPGAPGSWQAAAASGGGGGGGYGSRSRAADKCFKWVPCQQCLHCPLTVAPVGLAVYVCMCSFCITPLLGSTHAYMYEWRVQAREGALQGGPLFLATCQTIHAVGDIHRCGQLGHWSSQCPGKGKQGGGGGGGAAGGGASGGPWQRGGNKPGQYY